MNNQVKEIVFTGPDGKLVGKYKKGQSLNPPIALLIHPHPLYGCLLYTSPSPRDQRGSRMPSSA